MGSENLRQSWVHTFRDNRGPSKSATVMDKAVYVTLFLGCSQHDMATPTMQRPARRMPPQLPQAAGAEGPFAAHHRRVVSDPAFLGTVAHAVSGSSALPAQQSAPVPPGSPASPEDRERIVQEVSWLGRHIVKAFTGNNSGSCCFKTNGLQLSDMLCLGAAVVLGN